MKCIIIGIGDGLKECKIKFLSWIPINDKQTEWTKIRGRWPQ